MKYNSDIHRRQSVRLKGYDYAKAGSYFVTICVQARECLFGNIVDGVVELNEVGRIIADEWQNTANLRQNVVLDEFIVMPNHVHGIVAIADSGKGVLQYAPTGHRISKLRSPSQTIGAIIRGFKSAATKGINQTRNTSGQIVWQRNYYEHIIRNEDELNRIRDYIRNNPIAWETDRENPFAPAGFRCKGTARRAPTDSEEPWKI